MSAFRTFSNQRGLSILEALIGISIMIIGAAAMGTMMVNQNKIISHTQSKLDAQEIETLLKSTLNRENSCRISFNQSGVQINLDSPQPQYNLQRISSYDRNNQLIEHVIRENTRYGTSSLQVGAITFTNIHKIADLIGYGTLSVAISSPNGPALKPVTIAQVQFRLNADNTLHSCGTAGDLGASLSALLATTRAFTNSVCVSQFQVSVTATCGAGYALISCSGSTGDIDEHDEGYRLVPDFSTNSCTMRVQQPRCGDTGDNEALQRQVATAYCYKVD